MLLWRKSSCAIGGDGKWKGTIRKLYEHGRLAQILEDLLPQLDVQHASLEYLCRLSPIYSTHLPLRHVARLRL